MTWPGNVWPRLNGRNCCDGVKNIIGIEEISRAGLGRVTRNQGGDVGATHRGGCGYNTEQSPRVSAADILVCTLYTIYTFFFLNIVCQSAEVAATLNIHLAAAGG